MFYKLLPLLAISFLLASCSTPPVERTTLPADDFLIIAHRGASAYAPAHTIYAYELANQMGADYIELDLHMTQDKKLVALHDKKIVVNGVERSIANLTFKDIQAFSPGSIFNTQNPTLSSPLYESLSVPQLADVPQHFEDEVNYYIEIKSPASTPGMEKALIQQLREHDLLNRSDEYPKVIIQSYDANSLQKVFELEPSIPLIKLYSRNTTSISSREISRLTKYASGVGIDENLVTSTLVERLHEADLHVHPFVVNDADSIYDMMVIGTDGIFTDKPDIAVETKEVYEGRK